MYLWSTLYYMHITIFKIVGRAHQKWSRYMLQIQKSMNTSQQVTRSEDGSVKLDRNVGIPVHSVH